MTNLRKFLESPFRRLKVSRDKIFKFFEDHLNRLIQAVDNGEPFAGLVAATQSAFDNLKLSLGSHSSTLAQKESKTMTVDLVIEEFKTAIKLREANILIHFSKDSPVYQEFFPHGKTEYNNANKASIERLMTQIITAIDNHKSELGQPLLDEFLALQTAYITARNEQLKKMEDAGTKTDSWESSLEIMQMQAFRNLLTIALQYMGEPDKIELFFTESLIRARHYNHEGEVIEPYMLVVPPNSTVAADLSFSVDDKLYVEVTGESSLFYFGAQIAEALCPPTAIELQPGAGVEISALSLGAPANKYLLFTNKNTSLESEVEITLLAE
jgi:hypothetical protein